MTDDPHIREWASTRLADCLLHQFHDAWSVIGPNLAGLTDDEYFWEPVDGCWGVRRRDATNAPLVWGKGEWVVEHGWPPPSPPPFTTIGWRLMHAYDCLNDYFGRGLHRGVQDWNEIEVPDTAAGAVQLMTDLVHLIDDTLVTIDDEVLRRPAENDDQGRPAWAAVTFSLLEATHHCAEVGVLRDLFRHRGDR